MVKVFILVSSACILLACNDNSDSSTTSDTSNHAGHNKTAVHSKNQSQGNAIQETMDEMMNKMHGMKTTGNNDIDFAAMMVEHHKGAVEMSKVEIDKGNNPELKEFAKKVVNDQNKEVAFMQEFISKSAKTTSVNSAHFQKALNHSMMAMMNDTTTIYHNIDKDFAARMIPHHQSAVDMAKAYLQYGQDAGLRTLCQNIIESQTKEINWLNEWLAKNKE
jgi:uncharacterized protein (DUF305 family)